MALSASDMEPAVAAFIFGDISADFAWPVHKVVNQAALSASNVPLAEPLAAGEPADAAELAAPSELGASELAAAELGAAELSAPEVAAPDVMASELIAPEAAGADAAGAEDIAADDAGADDAALDVAVELLAALAAVVELDPQAALARSTRAAHPAMIERLLSTVFPHFLEREGAWG